MIACVDVDYRPGGAALAACLLFRDWRDASAESSAIARITDVADYTPGMFYQRELPCLLEVIATLPERPRVVVVDGYVDLDPSGLPGLGRHLFDALHGEVAIIGVAKTSFRTATHATPVVRGEGSKPLWVTSAGIDLATAADHVRAMHGPFRVPTLLREVDHLARNSAQS